jgi:cardiolipin synthase
VEVSVVTVPNLITLARLFLVPLIVWLMVSDKPLWAFWAFILAGVSDAVDGFLARRFDLRSDLGAYLDPLADKALLVSIYVTMSVLGEIPAWVTIIVVSRDLLIIGGMMLAWVLYQPMSPRPHIVSKINTLAQIVLAALVLADLAFPVDLAMFRQMAIYAVGLLTLGSAAIYAVDWIRHMNGEATPQATAERPKEGGQAP